MIFTKTARRCVIARVLRHANRSHRFAGTLRDGERSSNSSPVVGPARRQRWLRRTRTADGLQPNVIRKSYAFVCAIVVRSSFGSERRQSTTLSATGFVMPVKDIVFVTGNAKKLEEVLQMFKGFYKGSAIPFNVSFPFDVRCVSFRLSYGTFSLVCRHRRCCTLLRVTRRQTEIESNYNFSRPNLLQGI